MLLKPILKFFTSLRLTVVCLTLGLVLVFVGTLAQVDLGLYKAQNEFFRAFFVYWRPKGAGWPIPVFPGGYLLGSVLLINLIAAHIQRFTLSRKKIGIFMIHAGLILLLLGQLLTDMLSTESSMQLTKGETKDYSEDFHANELVVIDSSNPNEDTVTSDSRKRSSRGKRKFTMTGCPSRCASRITGRTRCWRTRRGRWRSNWRSRRAWGGTSPSFRCHR